MSQFFEPWHYDGVHAIRRMPEMVVSGDDFLLVDGDWRDGPFAFSELEFRAVQDGAPVYALAEGREGWRLGLAGPIPHEIISHLPKQSKYGGWIDRFGLARASLIFAGISAVALFIGLTAPSWVAPLVPMSWEKNLGDAMVGDFGGRFCKSKGGSPALQKLTDALDANADDLQVEVANIDMVNAIALPGGKVIIFEGLLTKAESADEVAGVLAHEIGHVRKRHVMQSLLRQMGLSVLLGGLDGNVGGALNGLLAMSYSRDAEREADEVSIAALTTAEISPLGTAGFFGRLSKDEGVLDAGDGKGAKDADESRTVAGYMSSHPMSEDRRKAFADSAIKGKKYAPSLTASEWSALKNMCKDDPKVKSDTDWFFD